MIVFKNINLDTVSVYEQIRKVKEEDFEFLNAIDNDDVNNAVEEFWDKIQASLGLLSKYGVSIENVMEAYPTHLEKIKTRPRKKNEPKSVIAEILGVGYVIERKLEADDVLLKNLDGYCDESIKYIAVCKHIDELDNLKNMVEFENKVLRHEIIHAYLSESGLGECSEWAKNEEMVDFFARQLPKIVTTMNELNIL